MFLAHAPTHTSDFDNSFIIVLFCIQNATHQSGVSGEGRQDSICVQRCLMSFSFFLLPSSFFFLLSSSFFLLSSSHSFVSVSLPLPLKTSDAIACHFCCIFDHPTPSLGRKMGFSGSGRVTGGARPFHPRMVRKTHSFVSVSLPPSLRTSDAIAWHFVARLIPPRPFSWQENEILRSRASNGRRAAVSPPYVQKNAQLLFRFTPLTLAHLRRHCLAFCCTFGEFLYM